MKSENWSVTIPNDFAEDEPTEDGDRLFRNPFSTMVVSLEEQGPITCKVPGAQKARGNECFEKVTRENDGEEWVYVTAQRGAIFLTAVGRKDDEKLVFKELNRVLDSARELPPEH